MRIIEAIFEVIIIFLVIVLFNTTLVKADSIFDKIRAFIPEVSIRQWTQSDNIRAATIPDKTGKPSVQNISNTCSVSKPGELAGGICCRNSYTRECRIANWQARCDPGFVIDVFQDCNLTCDNPAEPSPSPSTSPSRSPSQAPSRSPSANPSIVPINRMVIEIYDSENSHPDYDEYANNSCVVQGGRKVANGKACEFSACSFRPFNPGFRGSMGSSILRSNTGCDSSLALTLCGWDCVGVDNAIMHYSKDSLPPPPVTISPVGTRSIGATGSVTPSRTGNPIHSRTPAASGSRTPSFYYAATPYPSVRASFYSPTVTPTRSNTSN